MGHILKIPYYINIQKFEDIPHPKFETLLAPSLFDKGHSFYTLFISIWSMEVWGWLMILHFRSQKAEKLGSCRVNCHREHRAHTCSFTLSAELSVYLWRMLAGCQPRTSLNCWKLSQSLSMWPMGGSWHLRLFISS